MKFTTKFLCGLGLFAASAFASAGRIDGAYVVEVGAYNGSVADGIGGIIVLDRPANDKASCSPGDGSTFYLASDDPGAVSRMLGVAMTAKLKNLPVTVHGTGTCFANAENVYFIGLE